MINDVAKHYDMLIDMGNDPFYDTEELREYMDKWDGAIFVEKLGLDRTKNILEIGVGTGRLAYRTASLCNHLTGIDVSPKTTERAQDNLKSFDNITIINADFMTHSFDTSFDVIYSSLTFMHIENKCGVIGKVAELLSNGGRFVLSIDKNKDEYIDAGFSKIKTYPDYPDEIQREMFRSGLDISQILETEFAYIFVADKNIKNLQNI